MLPQGPGQTHGGDRRWSRVTFRVCTEHVNTHDRQMLALAGRLERPTDGVRDFCALLADELGHHGIDMQFRELPWNNLGLRKALAELVRRFPVQKGEWVLLQYTSLAWSRRGFPFRAPRVARAVRRAGARLCVVFHESNGFRAKGSWGYFRFAVQEWVIRRLYSMADLAIFTVPLEKLPWIPNAHAKARFIPITANLPESALPAPREFPLHEGPRTVGVFCITGSGKTESEVADICAAARFASQKLPSLRLIVFGRGSAEARPLLEKSMEGSGIELVVLGMIPSEEIARLLSKIDALLFVRGEVVPQRGTALAALACAVPLVGYGDSARCFPVSEGGIVLAGTGDRAGLCDALVRVLTDAQLWSALQQRSIDTYRKYFSWASIAQQYADALKGLAARIPPAVVEVTQAETWQKRAVAGVARSRSRGS
jgi:glycosyltransferase involved in cell wall biosynthesis